MARIARCGRFALGIAALLALAPGVLRAEAAAQEVKTPPGLEALDAEMQKRLAALEADAAKIRGLLLKSFVPVGQLNEDGLKKKMLELFAEELPPAVLSSMERAAKALGLLPKETDLGKAYPELLTSQIGGYYDPKRKYLALVQREGGVLGPELSKKLGPQVSARMAEMILVHELVHAIQDQHFDLEKFGHDKPMNDTATAKLALIEGDATLAMYSYLLKMPMEQMPGVAEQMEAATRNMDDMMKAMPEMPGSKELAAAPAFLRENLLFSYVQGLVFCLKVKLAGGQKLLDYAYSQDPPRSSEQILHPGKWLGARDDPVEIALPDLSKALEGYQKVTEGSLGEFNIRLLLSEKLGPQQRTACEEAAAGWGGDAFALYANGPREVLVWVTEWDTQKDAGEFLDAARKVLRQDWAVLVPRNNDKRVMLVRGQLTDATLALVQDELAAAKATPPANKRLDLAAIGVTAGDRPKPADMAKMLELLQDPAVRELMLFSAEQQGGDLGQMLNTPEVREALKNLLGDKGEGLDLGKLMDSPEFQQVLQQVLGGQKPVPKGQAQEGVYTNEQLGVRIRQPKDAVWKLNTSPQKPPIGAAPLVELTAPNDAARVVLAQQEMPMMLPIDQMAPFLEMGLQSQVRDYKKLKGGTVTVGKETGLELEFTGNAAGTKVHILQRVFLADGRLVIVAGSAQEDAWKEHGAAVQEVVESFEFIPKKGGAEKPEAPKGEAPPKAEKPAEVLKE